MCIGFCFLWLYSVILKELITRTGDSEKRQFAFAIYLRENTTVSKTKTTVSKLDFRYCVFYHIACAFRVNLHFAVA